MRVWAITDKRETLAADRLLRTLAFSFASFLPLQTVISLS